MGLQRKALTEAAIIVVAGYLLIRALPTFLANTIGSAIVGPVLGLLSWALPVVPLIAGARAARVAGQSRLVHGIGGALGGVALVLIGLTLLFSEEMTVRATLQWLVGGGLFAWLGVILEPYVHARDNPLGKV